MVRQSKFWQSHGLPATSRLEHLQLTVLPDFIVFDPAVNLDLIHLTKLDSFSCHDSPHKIYTPDAGNAE